ncbi:cingulin-like protein 1 isoform X3 [Pocillopora damicornis]|uniref:cingulin-like protein 1 isoform X3 n=1 Tax=Pocillopora damicornis TaxID=46731 RepID=UPI000F54E1E4|nr:cingulin-like protein 1 isoform X3 [Pocillopora damicornis]
MNIAQLLTSSTDNIEDNEFSYSRVHHLLTSKARPPQSVNNSGNNSHSFTNSKFVDPFCPSYSNMGIEIRNLQKALNFPSDTLSKTSTLTTNLWSNQNRTCQVFLTDSGYSSKADGQGNEDLTQSVLSSSDKISGAQGPATFCLENFCDSKINSNTDHFDCRGHHLNSTNLFEKSLNTKTHRFDSRGHHLNSSNLFEKSLKSSLDDSETKRILLLEKLREAHLTIQNQAEKLAGTESEICLLRGQLKSIAIQQEGLQEEIDCLTMEKKTLEFFKSESLKNHEAFLIRVNDLERELNVLTATHKTLQDEAKKKGTGLQKANSYATLQEENDKLQKDYKKLLQEHASIRLQLSARIKNAKEAKNKQHQLKQEIIQLRMERDLQCGKVSILEEEILNQQQNHNNMIKEQERLMKDKAEQDQKIQREIHDRLCLKMVNDLLKEESSIVKDAFQKLEGFVNSLEQSSKSMSLELEQCRQENLKNNTEEINEKQLNEEFLLKIASAKSHWEELENQISSLKERNIMLKKEKEEKERQLQLMKMCQETITKQQASKFKELKEENEKLQCSVCVVRKANDELQKQLEYRKNDFDVLKNSSKESVSTSESDKNCCIPFLEEEVDKIKENVTRLESEKTELIKEIHKLQEEQQAWSIQRSELRMTLAELSAESSQLRDQLKKRPAVNGIFNVRRDLELEKEEAVNKAKEEMKVSFDEVCLELKTVKSELSKVWEMLEIKDKQFGERSQELEYEHQQSQKWAEKLTQLRKDYADLAAITSSRSQMICTLRDELAQRCLEIIELESALSSSTQQRSNSVETSAGLAKSHQLTRRRSDGDIKKSCGPCCLSAENCLADCMGVKMFAAKDYYLSKRVEDLTADRDSALQNSQDLLHGMQQLREAYEEEIGRHLQQESTKSEKEKLFQVHNEDDDQLFGANSKLDTEVKQLTAQKDALEVKSKHLECERDELRNQVEELCRMKTSVEEKAVQVDLILSLRKRENKTTSGRKRSKSVGFMSRGSMQEKTN